MNGFLSGPASLEPLVRQTSVRIRHPEAAPKPVQVFRCLLNKARNRAPTHHALEKKPPEASGIADLREPGLPGPDRRIRIRGVASATKRFLLPLLGLCALATLAWIVWFASLQEPKPFPAEPARGFHWPYFLELPSNIRGSHILVIPNNTGYPSDDLGVHIGKCAREVSSPSRYRRLAEELGAPLLMPAFPRPESHPRIYTHALDRDVLTTELTELHRLDLQLLAMVDNALDHLRARGVAMEDTVLMLGFSASGMFVNRFSLLHPRRVLAAAVGSPGGWPLAPVAEWREEVLEYPVGVADLEALSGTPFDAGGFQRVRQFLFLGALDDNDSVPFSDGYDELHSRQIFRLFGAAPVDRWEAARRIYAEADVDAEFHLYDGEGHRLSDAMMADTLRFFTDVLEEASRRR
jgi:hypothetical protein